MQFLNLIIQQLGLNLFRDLKFWSKIKIRILDKPVLLFFLFFYHGDIFFNFLTFILFFLSDQTYASHRLICKSYKLLKIFDSGKLFFIFYLKLIVKQFSSYIFRHYSSSSLEIYFKSFTIYFFIFMISFSQSSVMLINKNTSINYIFVNCKFI